MIRTDMIKRLSAISSSIDRHGAHALADEMDRIARQLALPLEMFPGAQYSESAGDFVPRDETQDGFDDESGIFHVTTDLPGVMEGGLLSRDQLESRGHVGQGLGGTVPFLERPGMIATTYSESRARDIEDHLRELAMWNKGKVPTRDFISRFYHEGSEMFDSEDETWDGFVRDLVGATGLGDRGIIRRLSDGDESAIDELGERIDSSGKDRREVYDIIKGMEDALYRHIEEYYRYSDDVPPNPTPGLAAPFEAIEGLDPDKIGMLRLRARRGSDIDHIPQEEQLNFRSWDLLPELEGMEPEEARSRQQTTYRPEYPS